MTDEKFFKETMSMCAGVIRENLDEAIKNLRENKVIDAYENLMYLDNALGTVEIAWEKVENAPRYVCCADCKHFVHDEQIDNHWKAKCEFSSKTKYLRLKHKKCNRFEAKES